MGIAVSDWRLARSVSMQGQMGVVSGTALDVVLARRLQLGDPGGHLRRALGVFPFEEIAERVLDQYFIAGGKSAKAPFKSVSLMVTEPTEAQLELLVVANFVEVFLAIVASTTLAVMLAKKSTGRVDGFVVEGHRAGGHNASPRGALRTNSRGEPIYGERDEVDLSAFRKLGLPFWLAGSYGTPEKLAKALAEGAEGIQIGTAFAFCEESGTGAAIKRKVIHESRNGTTDVFTDPAASPTGFPFKVPPNAGRCELFSKPRFELLAVRAF